MKRLFSSLFVLLILLNVMGYYGVFLGLQYHNEREMIQRFNASAYDSSAAITIKIPLHTPDGLESENYERVDGDFVRDGKVYRLIKHRHFRDTFHIVCIQDETGTALRNALADYVKTFGENNPDTGQSDIVLPLFIKEYFSKGFSLQSVTPGWQTEINRDCSSTVFIDSFNVSIVHPPERA